MAQVRISRVNIVYNGEAGERGSGSFYPTLYTKLTYICIMYYLHQRGIQISGIQFRQPPVLSDQINFLF